ncbi:PREDICTED: odorant receptor Or1-like [Vollenhovia emeryi]|uniref:odorant receptor Or1-like n=1 Tax=Vollenhovia emeryi TaxID=411798 RepID=UPI0005F4C37E|nr:PREDICTED: odorant receptor Or1-like [Vollenhovia emeryi]
MQVMQFPLKILTVAGCRPPNSWSSLCKRTMYNAYTVLTCLLLLTFVLPQLMDIILNVDNPDDFTDTFYVMLGMVIAVCKMLSLLLNRKNIEMLTATLEENPFRPLEEDEIEIRQKYDNIVWTYSMFYTILVEMTCGCMNLTSLFTDFRKGNLAYREWIPYECSDTVYYFTYFRQLISLTVGSIVNVAWDITICGFLMHIYCQIEILECRVKKSLRNRDDLGECVHQHNHIYKFAHIMNEKFRIILAIQFIASMLVVCSNLYRLAKTTLSLKYIPLMSYTICMGMQIFIYCWYGNEVKLKSIQLSDEIFGMDWVTADKKVKENLIIIMNRSLIPIEFSSAYIITVNLDSFVKLLKMSYSVFNILKQTREEY